MNNFNYYILNKFSYININVLITKNSNITLLLLLLYFILFKYTKHYIYLNVIIFNHLYF